jgi:hypothetical protein
METTFNNIRWFGPKWSDWQDGTFGSLCTPTGFGYDMNHTPDFIIAQGFVQA